MAPTEPLAASGALARALARAPHLVLANLRTRAGDRAGPAEILRALLARPGLSPDRREAAGARLRALGACP